MYKWQYCWHCFIYDVTHSFWTSEAHSDSSKLSITRGASAFSVSVCSHICVFGSHAKQHLCCFEPTYTSMLMRSFEKYYVGGLCLHALLQIPFVFIKNARVTQVFFLKKKQDLKHEDAWQITEKLKEKTVQIFSYFFWYSWSKKWNGTNSYVSKNHHEMRTREIENHQKGHIWLNIIMWIIFIVCEESTWNTWHVHTNTHPKFVYSHKIKWKCNQLNIQVFVVHCNAVHFEHLTFWDYFSFSTNSTMYTDINYQHATFVRLFLFVSKFHGVC